MCWLSALGGQSIAASASVLEWIFSAEFLYDSLAWSPCHLRDSQESSSASQFGGITFSALDLLYGPALTSVHNNWENHNLTIQTSVLKVMSLLFNMMSSFVIAFLPRTKCLLISWLQSPSAVILEPPKIISHCFYCFPIYLPWSDRTRYHNLSFLNAVLSQLFHSPLSLSSRVSFFAFCHKGGVICISEVIDISSSNLDSSLCFFQPSVSHDVLCIEVK